jgi:cytochrome c peroxidase
MLDGRAGSLEEQIHLPVESPEEMDADWPTAIARLQRLPESMAAVSASGDAALSRTLIVKSLAAYVRSLVAGGSPFDRFYYLGDQAAISEQAKEGLDIFVHKARCSSCHQITGYSAPLTDESFHTTGVGFANEAYKDTGRFAITGIQADLGAFKTPTLRNVALRQYFMHNGSMTSLRQVIEYYNRGGNSGAPNLDGRIRPLYLSQDDINDVIAFLETLTSQVKTYQSLRDPERP